VAGGGGGKGWRLEVVVVTGGTVKVVYEDGNDEEERYLFSWKVNDVNNGKGLKNDGKKGFEGDLNGIQFPPINEVNKEKNLNSEENKECLDEGCNSVNSFKTVECTEKVNTGEEEVVKQSGNGDKTWGSGSGGVSLADLIKGSKLDNKLMQIPTAVSDNGEGIVFFDDEIIELARYHTRRMWNKFGLRDVIAENGVFYFKFQDEEGINEVINNGPWMVNNKPLVVQKWSIDMCMDKAEPSKIPVWVKMRNVPMEAWSVKGISALASSIGKPVIMDKVTTKMCVTGIGRIGFARVLVEIEARKGIKDKIEVMYRSKNINEGTKKIVNVEYSWIPSICTHCKLFGHNDNFCKKKNMEGSKKESVEKKDNEFRIVQNKRFARNGFNINRNVDRQNEDNKRKWNDWRNVKGNNKWQTNNEFEYRKKQDNEVKDKRAGVNDNSDGKMEDKGNKGNNEENEKVNDKIHQEGSTSMDNIRDGILGSNRFTLIDSLINEDDLVPNTNQWKIVDEFLNKEIIGKSGDRNGWIEEMKRYYRDRKEMFDATKDLEECEDVLDTDGDENYNVMRNE
ncbi:ATPase, F1/V1/A1 complex, alpha/beta subunit, partial [Tanacetum coccineum]